MTQKTNSTEEVTPAEIRAKAQIDLLTEQINRDQAKVSLLQSAIKDIHTSREVENRPDPLSKDLEALEGWKRAASGKCEYLRNAPLGLVEKVRSTKGGEGAVAPFHR
jgi:hypothetical protein